MECWRRLQKLRETSELSRPFFLQNQLSAKYVRNIISTMSAMWNVAVTWKYIDHKPFAELILPECEPSDVQPYSAEEVMKIFRAASER